MNDSSDSVRKANKRIRHRSKSFSDEQTAELIRFFRANTILWDPEQKIECNRKTQTMLKEQIATRLDHSLNDVNLQWNNIKSRFNVYYSDEPDDLPIRAKNEPPLDFADLTNDSSCFEPIYNDELRVQEPLPPNAPTPKQKRGHKQESSHFEEMPRPFKTEPTFDSEDETSMMASSRPSDKPNGSNFKTFQTPARTLSYSPHVDNDLMAKSAQVYEQREPSRHVCCTSNTTSATDWRSHFGEFIRHELNKYGEADAQRLKRELILITLDFKPTTSDPLE